MHTGRCEVCCQPSVSPDVQVDSGEGKWWMELCARAACATIGKMWQNTRAPVGYIIPSYGRPYDADDSAPDVRCKECAPPERPTKPYIGGAPELLRWECTPVSHMSACEISPMGCSKCGWGW